MQTAHDARLSLCSLASLSWFIKEWRMVTLQVQLSLTWFFGPWSLDVCWTDSFAPAIVVGGKPPKQSDRPHVQYLSTVTLNWPQHSSHWHSHPHVGTSGVIHFMRHYSSRTRLSSGLGGHLFIEKLTRRNWWKTAGHTHVIGIDHTNAYSRSPLPWCCWTISSFARSRTNTQTFHSVFFSQGYFS